MNVTARNAIVGAGLGAGLMYVLDPVHGRRRRALVRDKMMWAARKTRDAGGATGRDIRNRVQGAASLLRTRVRGDAADDSVLTGRARAELGRVASHPRAIHVDTCDGCVTLSGDVLASEVAAIMSSISSVRGVSEVVNEMTTHASAEHVPALQGESPRPEHWSTWMRSSWSPASLAAAGAALALIGAAAMRATERSA
jgi:BON domain-containing protein